MPLPLQPDSEAAAIGDAADSSSKKLTPRSRMFVIISDGSPGPDAVEKGGHGGAARAAATGSAAGSSLSTEPIVALSVSVSVSEGARLRRRGEGGTALLQ